MTGSLTAVLYNATTYRDADGNVAGVFAAARDVGELKRAEAEIRALNAGLERRVQERTRELDAANRELQEFVYSVAHDLRTPLRAVDGFSLTVLEDYGDVIAEQGRSDLQRVRAAAQSMGQLIDALLSLARVGRREVDVGQVDLTAIARRVIAELREAEPDRKVHVTIEDGLEVLGDVALLDVVLENLLGNAWKFTAIASRGAYRVPGSGARRRSARSWSATTAPASTRPTWTSCSARSSDCTPPRSSRGRGSAWRRSRVCSSGSAARGGPRARSAVARRSSSRSRMPPDARRPTAPGSSRAVE